MKELNGLPKFRNLATFSLTFYEGSAVALLKHIAQCNPELINMHLDYCNMLEDAIPHTFSKIQSYAVKLPLESILLSAQKLSQFVYIPVNELVDEALPLGWVVDAVAQQKTIADLELIQVGLKRERFVRWINFHSLA